MLRRKSASTRGATYAVAAGLALLAACRQASPSSGAASAPAAAAIGKISGETPSLALTSPLKSDMQARRDAAWETLATLIKPVNAGAAGLLPLFETWLDAPEFARVLALLPPSAEPTEAEMDAAIARVITSKAAAGFPRATFVDRHKYLPDPVKGPGVLRAGQTLFNQAFLKHLLRNRKTMLGCTPEHIQKAPTQLVPADAPNFAECFASEFPADAVMLKLTWYADDLPSMAYFESDAATLRLAARSAHWPIAGLVAPAELSPGDVVTVRSAEGVRFRLAAMHVATKTVRDWAWSTIWWSKTPDADFGQDRPAAIKAAAPAWSHYKMCALVDYVEADSDPGAVYGVKAPGLAASLREAHEQFGPNTWCANPYIEYEFTASSCVGCHQHGGLYQKPDLRQVRTTFPTDYTFLFERFRTLIEQAGR